MWNTKKITSKPLNELQNLPSTFLDPKDLTCLPPCPWRNHVSPGSTLQSKKSLKISSEKLNFISKHEAKRFRNKHEKLTTSRYILNSLYVFVVTKRSHNPNLHNFQDSPFEASSRPSDFN